MVLSCLFRTRLAWSGREAVVPEVGEYAVHVLLIGSAVLVEIEYAGLPSIAMHADEVFLVHHLVQISVAVANGFRIKNRIEGEV